jgi:hypothetical protein
LGLPERPVDSDAVRTATVGPHSALIAQAQARLMTLASGVEDAKIDILLSLPEDWSTNMTPEILDKMTIFQAWDNYSETVKSLYHQLAALNLDTRLEVTIAPLDYQFTGREVPYTQSEEWYKALCNESGVIVLVGHDADKLAGVVKKFEIKETNGKKYCIAEVIADGALLKNLLAASCTAENSQPPRCFEQLLTRFGISTGTFFSEKPSIDEQGVMIDGVLGEISITSCPVCTVTKGQIKFLERRKTV